jgi:hypothetical protein
VVLGKQERKRRKYRVGKGREKGEGRREKGEGRREKGEGRREKGEGRREKGEGRREGRREKGVSIVPEGVIN